MKDVGWFSADSFIECMKVGGSEPYLQSDWLSPGLQSYPVWESDNDGAEGLGGERVSYSWEKSNAW